MAKISHDIDHTLKTRIEFLRNKKHHVDIKDDDDDDEDRCH